MRENRFRRILALVLAGSMMFSLTACKSIGELGKKEHVLAAENLMENIRQNEEEWVQGDYNPETVQEDITDFAVRLFQKSLEEQENTLISPLSVMMALAMTANGAKGNTLAQMNETFGVDISDLNAYLAYYNKALPRENNKFNISNSIWFRDAEFLHVEEDFLKTNYRYYNADVFKAPFDDTTLEDINSWVEQSTDGLIKDILDEIPEAAVMYLINALIFEAEWEDTYDTTEIRNQNFTTESGEKQDAKLMYSMENLYLENDKMTGFIKYYKNRDYAFVALLPKEGISVKQCVEGLNGQELRALLENPTKIDVDAAIPQFKIEYDVLLNDVLGEMGMTDAFNGVLADFTGLGTSDRGNIFINRVIHKTYIEVSPQGTKAGAATVVEMMDECAAIFEDMKTVHLDRPFIYMLIDCTNNQPFFMGTVMEVE